MRKLKEILLLSALTFGCIQTQAQLTTGNENLLFNPVNTNPALAGLLNNQLSLGMDARWLGLDGAPKTGYLSYDRLFDANSGWNISLRSDNLGPLSSVTLSNAYAYHAKTGEHTNFSLGIRHTLSQHYLHLASQRALDPNDPLLQADMTSPLLNNFDCGLSFYNASKFLIGISARNIIPQRRYRYTQDTEVPIYSIHGWYRHAFSDDLALEATALLNDVENMPLYTQFSAMAVFQKKIGVGLNYSPNNQVGLFAYLKTAKRFNIFYGYNMPTSALNKVSFQSHTIGVSYRFGKDETLYDSFFIQPTSSYHHNRLF